MSGDKLTIRVASLTSVEAPIEQFGGVRSVRITFVARKPESNIEFTFPIYVSLQHYPDDADLIPVARDTLRHYVKELLDLTAEWELSKEWLDSHSVGSSKKR